MLNRRGSRLGVGEAELVFGRLGFVEPIARTDDEDIFLSEATSEASRCIASVALN